MPNSLALNRLAPARWSQYVLGDTLSVADFNLLPFFRWGHRVGLDMRAYPNWVAHTERMLERPSVREALAVEEISLYDTLPLPDGVTLRSS